MQDPVQVRADFRVDGDSIGSRRDDSRDQAFRLDDHQMRVQGQRDVGAKCGNHPRPECEVRDELVVHHVQVQPIGPGELAAARLRAELREVAG